MISIGNLMLAILLGITPPGDGKDVASPKEGNKVLSLLESELLRLHQLLEVIKTGGTLDPSSLEGNSIENRIRVLDLEKESLTALKAVFRNLKEEQKNSALTKKTEPGKEEPNSKKEAVQKPPSEGVKKKPSEEEILDMLRLANALFAQKKYKDALETYEKTADSAAAQEDWILFQRANCLGKLGKPDEAEKNYRKLQKDFPKSFWATQAGWDLKYIAWKRSLGGMDFGSLLSGDEDSLKTGRGGAEKKTESREKGENKGVGKK